MAYGLSPTDKKILDKRKTRFLSLFCAIEEPMAMILLYRQKNAWFWIPALRVIYMAREAICQLKRRIVAKWTRLNQKTLFELKEQMNASLLPCSNSSGGNLRWQIERSAFCLDREAFNVNLTPTGKKLLTSKKPTLFVIAGKTWRMVPALPTKKFLTNGKPAFYYYFAL